MDGIHKLYDLLWSLLEQLPSLIAILACIVFAATRYKRQHNVSLLVLAGLVLLLLHGPIFAAVYTWVPDLLIDRTRVTNLYTSNVMVVLGLLYHAALVIPFALLLVGIFTQRSPAQEET